MERYDFDLPVERRGTDSVKADDLRNRFGRSDLIPLWVADMDFRTPPFIVEALKKRCEHEVFGYTFASDAYYNSIINWVSRLHRWPVEREWLSYIPGIVKGIGLAIMCFTKPGDKVIIQPPVYHPFRIVPTLQGRVVVDNPLKTVHGKYAMDFEQLESVIDDKCKLFILCNPHNPGGIVWEKETLRQLAKVCSRHGILVISDEIHAEMVYPEYTHYPFATVSEAAGRNSITFMAPSKTFNIAGIVSSYAIIPEPHIRKKFFDFLEAAELADGTIFAYEATLAAYTYGENWRRQMLNYVRENVAFVDSYLKTYLPAIQVYRPQASFLIWLDCRELALPQTELVSFFINEARLALNDGSIFGTGGEGYMRLNVGCPRSILEKALNNLKTALERK